MTIAVLVNERARRGSSNVGALARTMMPDARIAVTRSLDDARRWIREELAASPPSLLLAGGGDGTTVGLLNEFRSLGLSPPPIGLLPLGTGNAWANVTRAPSVGDAIGCIANLAGKAPPLREFSLLEVDGRVTHFVGTGYDAELISDFHQQLARAPRWLRGLRSGVFGYLWGAATLTLPRHLRTRPPRLRLLNLGGDAFTVDADGRTKRLPVGPISRVLYEGPATVAAASTTAEWGFGFRAFPFADRFTDRISVRIYAGSALQAVRHARGLWTGQHPMPGMFDFFLTHGRIELDREAPFEVGGDLAAPRRAFEFKLVSERIWLVDWSRLI